MVELKILTFNVWGLAFISKDRPARMAAIAEYLASADYDIVCLQEIWVHDEFVSMWDYVRRTYEHARFFHTGALGSGLAIFSKLPFKEAKALPYSLSGLPSEVIAGDFFVNKAAGRVLIEHPKVGEIEVWTTHMHAGSEAPPDTRQSHRMAQAWQLATEVRRGAACGRIVLCTGDFNSQPFSVPIALLRTYGGLRDSFLDTHARANDSIVGISAADAITTSGMTCDSSLNTYSEGKGIPPNITAQGGKRLDYIFYREGRGSRFAINCTESTVVLDGCIPGQTFSYSDHFGLSSTFRFEPRTWDGGANSVKSATSARPLLLDDEAERGATPSSSSYELSRAVSDGATVSAIRHALSTLRDYTFIAARRNRLHIYTSFGAVAAAIVLAVGSAWQPKSWIQPIFTIVAAVLGFFAATYFYWGWLWGRWERGLLDETMADMEMELNVLNGQN